MYTIWHEVHSAKRPWARDGFKDFVGKTTLDGVCIGYPVGSHAEMVQLSGDLTLSLIGNYAFYVEEAPKNNVFYIDDYDHSDRTPMYPIPVDVWKATVALRGMK